MKFSSSATDNSSNFHIDENAKNNSEFIFRNFLKNMYFSK